MGITDGKGLKLFWGVAEKNRLLPHGCCALRPAPPQARRSPLRPLATSFEAQGLSAWDKGALYSNEDFENFERHY